MYAILEIGSNAIKGLVYNENLINAHKIYQIKYINNIDISSPDIIKNNYSFFQNISSLMAIFKNFNILPENIYCIATQVLRHKYGEEICKYILSKFNLDVKILTGEEEAKLSAYGVIFGICNANGLMLDLGGGSLELAFIKDKDVLFSSSLPLGIKTLNGQLISDKQILEIISSNHNLNKEKIENLYLSGGCFRVFGKKYLDSIKINIKNIHNLEIKTENFIKFIIKFKYSLEDQIKLLKNKISEYNAISIIESLVTKYAPKFIIISNYSLQEGIRYQRLSEEEKKKNFLLEQVKKITGISLNNINKTSYLNFIMPYIENDFKIEDLIEIIIIFLQYSNNFENVFRSHIISQMILYGYINFSNKQRIYIAIILQVALSGAVNLQLKNIGIKILTKEEFSECYIIGLMFFCIANIDGVFASTPSFGFDIIKKNILTINRKISINIFVKIKKILKEIYIVHRSIKNKQFNYSLLLI
ncbi:MAG: hypothetical protein U1E31_01755 [Rickettsiales bacterium]